MMSERGSSGGAEPERGVRPDCRLHLPSLSIEGFRGLKQLSIPRLGRVTLLAGRNGVGKTTVLDAVRMYASRGRQTALNEMLVGREEITVWKDPEGTDVPMLDGKALFYGRDTSGDASLSIGPLAGGDRLRIAIVELSGEPKSLMREILANSGGDASRVIKVMFGDAVELMPRGPHPVPRELMQMFRKERSELPPELVCESLGPGLPESGDIARLWDRTTLTDDEDRVIRALNLAIDGEAVRVAAVGGGAEGQGANGRRVVARIEGHSQPVPLRSLGDGAVRLLGVAMALASGRGGFLLIDEAENGIHHRLQRDFWRMVLETAEENNVQVLATTHGWDCVRGFAEAAVDLDAVEGVLVRLERRGDHIRAIEYPENELAVAAQDGIEVR